jgi:cyclohexanone monooxygenase
VGAGFAGLYMLHRLRESGLSARVLERAPSVGGTWFWNRYPGARCDVESIDYSYSFSEELQQEWTWTERYPSQAEILRYLNHVADRFDLRRDIQLETAVERAEFDEGARRWTVLTAGGEAFSARYCVMATGCLSAINSPSFPGLETFAGDWYHTARWPLDGVDFTGRRVGVVGTGSTGVQLIPEIAKQADHLTVFQRTPNFVVPARNRPLDDQLLAEVKASYSARRLAARDSAAGVPIPMPERSALEVDPAECERVYEDGWQTGGAAAILYGFWDLLVHPDANETAARFVRRKIAETVNDPAVAASLTPTDHPIGTKRICIGTDYYETYNRDNVTLVDVRRAPIAEITQTGLRTHAAHYELDALVFATGFDAMTGALLEIDVRGRDGRPLKATWAEGPRTYLGLAVHGFPNMFIVTGPGSPSVISNMVTSIEQHVEWIADCIGALDSSGETIEATREAQEEWVAHVGEVAHRTLYPKASSWYVGANIAGKPRVFMPYVGGVGSYRKICDEVADAGYRGFERAPDGGATRLEVEEAAA